MFKRFVLSSRNFVFYFFSIAFFMGLIGLQTVLIAQYIPYKESKIKFSTIKGNLSEGTITSIVQDYKGVLWFGTRNGLNRYNGTNFSVYEHDYKDSTSLSNTYVNCLMEDSENNLWVGTANGLNLYERNKDKFRRFQFSSHNNASISNNAVHAIFEDSKKMIWIGTEGGVNRYDPKTGIFTRFIHTPEDTNSLVHNYVRAIFEDREGNVWVGTYGGGLDRYDPQDNRFVHYQNDPKNKNSLSSNFIRTSFKDRNGDIWIGTKKGLNLLDKKDDQYYFRRFLQENDNPNSLLPNVISAINQDNLGNLWVGTENGGLYIFNQLSKLYTNYLHNPRDPTSIRHNSIWSIYRDNVGTMWVGMLNKGINKLDKHHSKFKHFNVSSSENSLTNGNVTCFHQDKINPGLWIGTDGGGLNFYDKRNNVFEHFLHEPFNENSLGSNAVTAISTDNRDNLWIGTWEGGLNLYNRKTKQFKRYLHNPSDSTSISSNNVFSILEDSKGRLWIGAYEGGLELFDRETGTFAHFRHDPKNPSSLVNNKVFDIFEDSKGNIWIGTEGGGISVLKATEKEVIFTNFQHDPKDISSLGSNTIINITEDKDQNIWIGTFGGGLSLYDPANNTFKTFRKEHGLPSNVVHGILEDDNGNLWISTNQGISKFDIKEETFRNYSTADGLQAQEFIRGAAYKMSDGEMLFGGINGFNYFYPLNIVDNPNIPPVYITEFSIYGNEVKPGEPDSPLRKHISDTEKVVLDSDQNVFSFELSALNYSQASENQYAYKLEGYDKGWQYIGKRRNVYYTKVPPGNYTFKVKGSNNDGIWNEKGSSLEIIINPPWYATKWAYAGYILAIIYLLYLYRLNLINKERLKSDLKLEQMELSKMHEIDQMKSNFFANISHEFRTPLTLILGPLKAMQSGKFEGDLKSQLKMMIRNIDRLMLLINQLLDLSKLGEGSMKLKAAKYDIVGFVRFLVDSFSSLAENRSIKLNFKPSVQPLELFFDPDKLEKVVINLLSNAIKFTEREGEIELAITTIKKEEIGPKDVPFSDYLLLEVKDSGVGIASEDLDQIFNRFYQADNVSQTDMSGTGIGLSLTKELVELHRGFIKVESKVKEGTTFRVFLPLGDNHLKKEEIISDPEVLSPKLVNGHDYGMISLEESKEEEQNLRQRTRKDLPLILIVEDNNDLRHYITNQLRDHYHVIEAEDGKKGFEKAMEILPALIISDVMMPEMNGYELCRKLKEEERTNHIPIILLTAKTSVENLLEGLETGADYYLTKPFDSQLLLLRVKNIMRSKENLQDHFKSKNLLLEPKKVILEASDEKFLKDAIACIEDNISSSEFGVEDFGKVLGFSRMQLYRKLKALTGQSPNEFIRSIKLKRAAQLLETGELTISEITYEVGFNDLKHFRACFKKEFGVNPSHFCGKMSATT